MCLRRYQTTSLSLDRRPSVFNADHQQTPSRRGGIDMEIYTIDQRPSALDHA